MNNSFEINYIKKCLELAEARLNRGDGSEWTTYDFEKLSEAIEEATGVILSITTLKRLWGKLKYTNIPATTTLNTLAQFAGYADWREFKRLVVLAPGGKAGAVPGEAGNAGAQSGSLPGNVTYGDTGNVNVQNGSLPGNATPADTGNANVQNGLLPGNVTLGEVGNADVQSGSLPGNAIPGDTGNADVQNGSLPGNVTPGDTGNANVQNGSLPGDVVPGEAGKTVAGADAALTNTAGDKLPGNVAAGADVISADGVAHPLLAGTATGHIPNNPATYSSKANGGAGSYANNSPATPRKRRKWTYWLLALLPLGILVYALLLSNTKPGKPLNTAAFSFSSNKIVREGVPNSVIFNYNAVAAGKDSVFISQSWDIRRKVPVSAKENTFTTIYYTPGYFRAKLMVDKQIVKEHDLMIGSGGWLALAEQEPGTPLYFCKNEVMKGNGVEVDETLLSQYHLPLQPTPPALRFFYVQSFGDLKNDHFTFETTLKSGFRQGTAACQRVEVLILCKNDVIVVPLCAPGCVGELSLFAAGTAINSKNADLSKFGADLAQWVKLRVVTRNRHMQFYVNDTPAAELNFSNPPSDIVGVQYRFSGTGAVKDTRFTKDSTVIELQQ